MPETPHTMIYAPLSDAPGAMSVYQCCGTWSYLGPQAMFHLWREHGLTAEAASAQVEMVRELAASPSTHHPGSNAAPPMPMPPTSSTACGQPMPSGSNAAAKQAIIDESLACFRSRERR